VYRQQLAEKESEQIVPYLKNEMTDSTHEGSEIRIIFTGHLDAGHFRPVFLRETARTERRQVKIINRESTVRYTPKLLHQRSLKDSRILPLNVA
jgi:hypothetical protein